MKPPRLFYGWVVVGTSFIGSTFAAGVFIWAPSVFVVPMREELGWTLSEFFVAFTVRAILAAVIAPIVGPMLDTRNGTRTLAIVSALALGASQIGVRFVGDVPALDFIPSQVQFYLLFGVLGAIAWQGSGFTMAIAIVPKWFVVKRGRAVGIAGVGAALGPATFPPLTQALISLTGWRDAWLWLGVITLIVLTPLALLMRTRPEDMGLHPDGAPMPPPRPRQPAGAAHSSTADEGDFTRARAVRSLAFWMIVSAVVLAGVGFQGFQPHWVPYLREAGFVASVAALGPSVYGVFSALSRLLWGTLAERFSVRKLLAVEMLLTGLSIFLLIHASHVAMVMAFMAVAGLTMGGFFTLQPLLVAEYFGRSHLGAVNSAMLPFGTMSGAVAPVLVAWLRDVQGDYVFAFFIVMAHWYAASAIIAMTRAPRTRRDST